MAKGKGFKKKLIILLTVFVVLVLLAFLNQKQIIKHLYKHRYLGNLVSKTAQRSGRQSKILNFNFPLNALNYFYSFGNVSAAQEKRWLEADLKIGNENYAIKFSNFDNYFKRLKLKNKNRALTIRFSLTDVTGTEDEFNLFQVKKIDFLEQELIYELARRLKIYIPRTEHVNVYVNYIDQGDYFLKHSYSKFFIEKSGITDSIIFMLDKNEKGNWAIRFLWNEPKKGAIRDHFKHFIKLMRKKDGNLLEKYFDLEYLARIELLRHLLGAETGFTIEDNIRFLCKKSNGRFYPILDEANIYNKLQNRKNKNFELLTQQIDQSSIIAQKMKLFWTELAGNYDDILLKYREITKKHLRLNPDLIFSLKLKIIAHYYLHHVYSQLKRTTDWPGYTRRLDKGNREPLEDAENYLDHLIISPHSLIKTNQDLNIRFKDNRFSLEQGDYHISRDIIIPEGYIFDIMPGTRLRMAGGVSIVSYSPLNILGTKNEPVVIQAQDANSPFGVFAVHGIKEQTCRISHLDFSGASRAVINGVGYDNGLNLHNINLEMRSSKIHHVRSDAGLRILNGSVLLSGNAFYNNFSDQVALEFCSGLLQNNRFSKENGDPKGDGLAIDGSKVAVVNNRFSHFQDKGISVGKESQVILYNNTIQKNHIGVAAKDSAAVLLLKNKFYNNGDAVSAFQKSRLFKGGRCYYLNNRASGNLKLFEIDKFSTFFQLSDCRDAEEKLSETIKNGQFDPLFPLFSQIMDKCAGPQNQIESFSLGKHPATIDENNRIIFVNLPVGSGPRQTINYQCRVQKTDIHLYPVMIGTTQVRSNQSDPKPVKVENQAPYDFKEFIFTGKISFFYNNRYDLYDLVVTTGNSAVIKIDTRDRRGKARIIKDEPKIACKFVIFTPDGRGEKDLPDYQFYHLDGKIEGRGQKWPKWKYGISFEKSIPISGMDQAKNWVLESSYVEKSLMRSKVAFDLLAQIQQNNGKNRKFAPQSQFVELILNDRYIGVYLLMQHINDDFLGLEKFDEKELDNAALYRCRDENANFSSRNFFTKKNKDYRFFPGRRQPEEKERDPILGWHSGFSQRHPDLDKFGEYWGPLEEFCKFTALSPDTIFQNRLFNLLDRELFIELWIFIQLLDDHDGVIKNRYLARHKGNSAKWFFVPWDKDGIFGRSFNMKKRPHTEWLDSYLFNRVMKIKSFRDDFKKKWQNLRKSGIIDSDNIFKIIENNKKVLKDLQERNFRKWPANHFYYPDKKNFGQEIDYMKKWISQRIIWLDKRINEME